MGRQLISVGVGMRVVPGKSVLLLGMMRELWMGMVHGMMLVLFTVSILIRACVRFGRRGFWIPWLAIWSVSWRHSYTIRSMLLKQSSCGGVKHLILWKNIITRTHPFHAFSSNEEKSTNPEQRSFRAALSWGFPRRYPFQRDCG